MHSPQLIDEILALKLKLDLCDPSETAGIQKEIVERMELIQTISKVPWARVKSLINSRYSDFIKEKIRSGELVQAGTKTVRIPKFPPQ